MPRGWFGEFAQGQANPLDGPSIQSVERNATQGGEPGNTRAAANRMTTWQKRDWQQFYELSRRPWRRHRPPRPVYPTGMNRVLPAAGFSLSELDDAGVDLDLAERLGLPVDAGRIGAYGPNVTVLRDFVRSSRHPV
jgi:ribosomal protein L13E